MYYGEEFQPWENQMNEPKETQMEAKGRWESLPNENINYLHLTIEFWDSIHVEVYNVPLSDCQKQLISDLEVVRGVVNISFQTYTIRVQKGTAFDWKEIRPHIESIVSSWSGQPIKMGEEKRITN